MLGTQYWQFISTLGFPTKANFSWKLLAPTKLVDTLTKDSVATGFLRFIYTYSLSRRIFSTSLMKTLDLELVL